MNISEISRELACHVQTVVSHLLPNGKRVGNEWKVGGVEGDAGQSMGVHLTGDKAGVWADFATGESGDLIDLWCAVRSCSPSDAMKQATDFLGINFNKKPTFDKRQKTYQKPTTVVNPATEMTRVMKYLTSTRMLSQDTVTAFNIGESPKGAIFFPYHSPDGELVMVKWRSIAEKRIGVTEKDMKPCLFGWQAVPPSARTIVICEGEFDAMAFREFGVTAMSVPFGGGGGSKQDWIEHEFDNLNRFDTIYLAMDMDDEGRKATQEILSRLGRHRCRIVHLPHKDANDCLIQGCTDDEIWSCLKNAKTLDPEELRSASEYLDDIIREFNPSEDERGIKTPWPKADTLRFRTGEVTVISGINGHGKSEAVGHLTLHAMSQGEKVCVASMEFKPKRFLRNIVRQASGVSQPTDEYVRAIVDRLLDPHLWVFDVTGTALADRMLEVFKYAHQRYGVKLFVIDNLSKLDVDMDKNEPQRQFMAKLCDFAKDNEVHVFLVTHQKKSEDEYGRTGKMDVKGSGAITDLADTVIIWSRNKKKEDQLKRDDLELEQVASWEEKPDAWMRCEKQRNGEDEPKIGLWWHPQSHQFLPFKQAKPIEYVPYARA